MNGKYLLITLGDISHKYYDEAENETISSQRPKPLRRPLLIAAILALTALLVGCAVVYVMRMQDLQIGEHTIIQSQQDEAGNVTGETEIQLEILSLQGIKGSANYLANQEWLQFTESYTPESGEYWESGEDYWAYSVQNQTMVDKLEEICEKYGLKVIGKPWHEHVDCNQFLPLVGIDHLLKAGSAAAIQIPQGRFFPGGSFNVYGNLTLPDVEMPQYISFDYINKDVFYDVFAYVDSSTVTERSYTTEDGISLLLLESEQSGMILADREDCFISVSITLSDGISLEEVAEQFDFTIQAKPITDAAAAAAREQASIDEAYADDPAKGRFARATYREYVEDLLWSDSWKLANGFTMEEIPEREYAFHDLDGNGEEELLIFYDGYICTVVGWKDGKTDEGKSYRMVLCEDNVLIEQAEIVWGETWYHIFYFANNGETVFSNPKEQSIVRLKNDNGTWWRTSSTDHYADFDTQITEEEAMAILNSYTPVTLDTRPLTQFEEPQ